MGDGISLVLTNVTKKVGAHTWLHDLSIAPPSGGVTVLLGATQAGKTSLMRIMAGLDSPTTGSVAVDGKSVVGVPVRDRNVAMVYQQFINYPSMKVRDNIASPLKLRGDQDIDATVNALAEKLHIEMFLDRYPAELSGGQQQRVALARALAKAAPLMLLDEPLVNLDYKLREELREELSALFTAGHSTVIYATTEPSEALLLGGHTAVMDKGELLQFGPTADVFHHPSSLRVARAFSDPPMNLLAATASNEGVHINNGPLIKMGLQGRPQLTAQLTVGLRASALGLRASALGLRASALKPENSEDDLAINGVVELVELSGSDTFVHVASALGQIVGQLTGVHNFTIGSALTLYFNPQQIFVFDELGSLLVAPPRRLKAI